MKLLLDEMHSRVAALALRARAHDVLAVTELPALVGLPDPALLQWATSEERALVTENLRDFAPLHNQILAAGGRHCGLVFTPTRRFPRSARNYIGTLTEALAVFLDDHADGLGEVESFLWWLDVPKH